MCGTMRYGFLFLKASTKYPLHMKLRNQCVHAGFTPYETKAYMNN